MKEQLRAICIILIKVFMPFPADLYATWCICMFLSLLQVCNPIVEKAFILCPVSFLDLSMYKTLRQKFEDPYPTGAKYVHYYSRNVKRNSNREQDPRLLQVTICCVKMLCFLGLHNTIFC